MRVGTRRRMEDDSSQNGRPVGNSPAIFYRFCTCISNERWITSSLIAIYLGLAGTPAVALPGDGHWDRQFNMPGTATRNIALGFNGNLLYTGGYSLSAGQIATNTVVNIFDGTNWTTIGEITGSSAATVIEEFAFLGNDLFVGGLFNTAGDVQASGLAKWNGKNWSAVGGFSGFILTMTSDGTNLYVGGSFTNCGGVLITNVAKWNGTNWSAMDAGIGYYDSAASQFVKSLLWRNGQLYAGGAFTNAGNVAATNLARWDGFTWSQLGGGVPGTYSIFTGSPVSTMHFLGSDLYVGGFFTIVGGNVPALNIARWNGSSWSALGSGLKGPPNSSAVNTLTVLGSELYATGNFTNAGGLTARVAKWDGVNWSSLGAINGTGSRAASNSGSLYICGDFSVANFNTPSNVIGNHILRWDGSTWNGVDSKPGKGTHTFVQALGWGSDGLYMGGAFNVIATTTASRISRWDGTNWFALGDGVAGPYNANSLAVRAIKAQGSQLFVGGGFTTAGGLIANNVAAWDGNNWSTLGYGVDNTVFAVETTGTDVYVGGSFTNAYDFQFSGTLVNRIAIWNSSTGWLPLGSGVNGTVNAISAANGVVYVGGAFTTAGGNTANRVAIWDGANWSALGTGTAKGLSGTVSAILVDGSDVYVGGSFTTAGGIAAPAIAKWNGSSWSAVGQGMFHTSTASVGALARLGSYLYATGVFTNAGGSVITRNIARWDGTKWDSLGSGIGNESTSGASRGGALATSGNDLFVGGIFETAGLADSGYIAHWNDQIDFTPRSLMRLANPQMLPGNNFKFRATASEHASYVIEYSADLVHWAPLATNSLSSVEVTNSVPGVNIRTYRMREIP